MKATCRQEFAPSSPVLSCDIPSRSMYSPAGTLFHCLQATSQALQPMQTEVSVKKPDPRRMTDVPGVARHVVQRAEQAVAHEPSSLTLVGRVRCAAVSDGELASSLTSPRLPR